MRTRFQRRIQRGPSDEHIRPDICTGAGFVYCHSGWTRSNTWWRSKEQFVWNGEHIGRLTRSSDRRHIPINLNLAAERRFPQYFNEVKSIQIYDEKRAQRSQFHGCLSNIVKDVQEYGECDINANLSILYGGKGKPYYWGSWMFSWAPWIFQYKYYSTVITAGMISLQIFFPQLGGIFYPKRCRIATFFHWVAITFGLEGNLLAQLCQLELSMWIGWTHGVVSFDGFFYTLMPPTNPPLPSLPQLLELLLYSTSPPYSLPRHTSSRLFFFFLVIFALNLIKLVSVLLHQL